jgi:hypothetical protein
MVFLLSGGERRASGCGGEGHCRPSMKTSVHIAGSAKKANNRNAQLLNSA